MKRNFFLEHPVFSMVLSIVIVIVGGIGLAQLPIDQYPQIVPPVVRISATYPGADAQTVTQAVATPIEHRVTLVNSPGRRARAGLGISARTENVPVLGSTCGSAKSP